MVRGFPWWHWRSSLLRALEKWTPGMESHSLCRTCSLSFSLWGQTLLRIDGEVVCLWCFLTSEIYLHFLSMEGFPPVHFITVSLCILTFLYCHLIEVSGGRWLKCLCSAYHGKNEQQSFTKAFWVIKCFLNVDCLVQSTWTIFDEL